MKKTRGKGEDDQGLKLPQVVLNKKDILQIRLEAAKFVEELKTQPGVVRDIDASQRLANLGNRLDAVLASMTDVTMGRLRLDEYLKLCICEQFSRQTSLRGDLSIQRDALHARLVVLQDKLAAEREVIQVSANSTLKDTAVKVDDRMNLQDTARAAFDVKLDKERQDRKEQANMSLQSIQDSIDALRLRFEESAAERKKELADLTASIQDQLKPLHKQIAPLRSAYAKELAEVSKKSDRSYETYRIASDEQMVAVNFRITQWQAAILSELKERVRGSVETATLTESFLKTVEAGIASDSANLRAHVTSHNQ